MLNEKLPYIVSVFPLGQTVATPGALDALEPFPDRLLAVIRRHAGGDWGLVCEADQRENERALKHGDRLLSAYPIDPEKRSLGWGDNTVWIITEGDRSVTTVLLPDDY